MGANLLHYCITGPEKPDWNESLFARCRIALSLFERRLNAAQPCKLHVENMSLRLLDRQRRLLPENIDAGKDCCRKQKIGAIA